MVDFFNRLHQVLHVYIDAVIAFQHQIRCRAEFVGPVDLDVVGHNYLENHRVNQSLTNTRRVYIICDYHFA